MLGQYNEYVLAAAPCIMLLLAAPIECENRAFAREAPKSQLQRTRGVRRVQLGRCAVKPAAHAGE
jgi:hypothetical protein